MLDIREATKILTNKEIKDYVNQMTIEFFTRRTTMATYTSKQSVLDEVLGDFKDYGFNLVKIDTFTVELYFKDKKIAIYNWDKVTFKAIQDGCANYLKSIAGWQ